MTLFDSTNNISVHEAAWSPNCLVIVAACSDHTLKMWDSKIGAYLRSLRGHSGAVTSLSFSVDGSFLVSCSTDGTVRVWDMVVQRGQCLSHRYFNHQGKSENVVTKLNSISFSPAGLRLCIGSEAGDVRQWTVAAEGTIE